jgi:F0F1-type ATP synthase delta subunit
MPLEQPSEEDRQSVLAEVEQFHSEYLKAKHEFLRVLAENNRPGRMSALTKAARARKVALSRYITAAAKAAGSD